MTENGPKPHSLQTIANVIDEGALTKGQLRTSVGKEIGERAFAGWLASEVMGEFLPPDQRPPSTLLGVQALAYPQLLVEIDGMAVID